MERLKGKGQAPVTKIPSKSPCPRNVGHKLSTSPSMTKGTTSSAVVPKDPTQTGETAFAGDVVDPASTTDEPKQDAAAAATIIHVQSHYKASPGSHCASPLNRPSAPTRAMGKYNVALQELLIRPYDRLNPSSAFERCYVAFPTLRLCPCLYNLWCCTSIY